MLMDIKLSKMIQSGQFLCIMLGNLGKKVVKVLAISLARDNLPGFVSSCVSNATNKFEGKKSKKWAARGAKDLLYLFCTKIWMKLLKS